MNPGLGFWLRRSGFLVMDSVMCSMMNIAQWRLRHHSSSREDLEAYLDRCALLDRETFYETPPMRGLREQPGQLDWESPLPGPHRENNRAQADFFPATNGKKSAPTLILLHALMSAHDLGYRRIARRLNRRGWNVLFPHLPFHYSRRPSGYSNGALAITSDLVRNGETLRQAAIEIRQLMGWAREQGSTHFGLLATSYGGWIGALTAFLEEFDFVVLLQPIADVTHATFESPAARVMNRLLQAQGIDAFHLERHAHLTAPNRGVPRCPPERLLIIGGRHDVISPPRHLQSLCQTWGGARYHEVEQGHFGYGAMQRALQEVDLLIKAGT